MTLETKINWSLGLSITSITVIVILVIMWFCNVWELSVIGIETFIGVIVALLAIIVTFVVGWQIYNTIEIRNKLSELDRLEGEIEKQKLLIENSVYQSRHLIAFTWATNCYDDGHYEETFAYALQSLMNSMKLNNPINIDNLLRMLEDSVTKVSSNSRIDATSYNEIMMNNNEIRNQDGYEFIRERYELSFSKYIKKIKINDR